MALTDEANEMMKLVSLRRLLMGRWRGGITAAIYVNEYAKVRERIAFKKTASRC